jgi:hypothetical protein
MFVTYKLTELWLLVKSDYPGLSDKIMKVLLNFVTTQENGFYAVAVVVMNTKYRWLLVTEKEPRVAISSMKLLFCKLCTEKQARPSR